MLFNSFGYLLFLAIAVAIHWLLPHRARIGLLGALSLLFYSMWRWEFALLMAFSAVVDFVAARHIHATDVARTRRAWLLTSLSINLGLLIVFKYTYFVSDSAAWLFGHVGYTGAGVRDLGFDIVLPLGISFYTFQTISYTIDVYRRVCEPTRSFASFITYVTFWPQLIAGPILRAAEVLPQLERPRNPNADAFTRGLLQILFGLCKKVVLADMIAGMVDDGFSADLDLLTALDVWVMTFLFGFQIYFDFSGYSDIAIGSAKLLGIEFPDNFNWPYLATSPREFWKRWHISLSSWIRDYLYLPLTGRRFQERSRGGIATATEQAQGETHPVLALYTTWFIMGLWHGAAWTFAVWGLYHAAVIHLYRAVRPLRQLSERSPTVGWAIMLLFAMAGWIPFRAQSLSDTALLFGKLVTPSAYTLSGRMLVGHAYLSMVAILGGMLLLAGGQRWIRQRQLPTPLRLFAAGGVAASLTFLLLVLQRQVEQFIYFQF